MSWKFSMLLGVLVITFCMTGCSNGNDDPTSEQGIRKLDIEIGQKFHYTSSEDGEEFGFTEYEVMGKDQSEGKTVYTIKSTLHLESADVCVPTEATAWLEIDELASPISYREERSLGEG